MQREIVHFCESRNYLAMLHTAITALRIACCFAVRSLPSQNYASRFTCSWHYMRAYRILVVVLNLRQPRSKLQVSEILYHRLHRPTSIVCERGLTIVTNGVTSRRVLSHWRHTFLSRDWKNETPLENPDIVFRYLCLWKQSLMGIGHSKYLGIGEIIILKWILRKEDLSMD